MRCRKCGSENPDYAFFCGRCAADLREQAQTSEPEQRPRAAPQPSLYTMLSRRLLVVENNIQKRHRGILRGVRESLYRGGNIVFRSESEIVTLVLDKDHHASLLKGPPSKTGIEFTGPQAAFLEMFPERGGFGHLPGSVSPRLKHAALDEKSELMIREIAEKMLESLFTLDSSVQ